MDLGTPAIPGLEHLEPIGQGGTATVYRAYQRGGERHVAVKVLARPVTDAVAHAAFLAEREILGRLRGGPGVLWTDPASGVLPDGRPYLVMELCESTLQQEVDRRGRLDPAAAAAFGYQIAQGLHYAHSNGAYHRDVKPANVLITKKRQAVLADFGAADAAGMVAVSPGFSAPERLAGQAGDPVAADLYGLGATLHYALAGSPPGSALPADVPPRLAEAVRRLLDPDPARRGANAGEALLALSPAAWQQSEQASPAAWQQSAQKAEPNVEQKTVPPAGSTEYRPLTAPEPEPAAAGERRRPRWLLAVAIAVPAALLLTGGIYLLGNRGGDPATEPSAQAARSAAPTGPATGAGVIELAEPVDNGETVTLTWTGPANLTYAVAVAEAGAASPQRKLVGQATTYQAPVKAGVQYCFQVLGTGGRTASTSAVKGIRGAVCKF
ncbi:protein kinase domain-containing protein [Dactylosporangium sp. CS-033363]|uniref:serine/threonine-protein kinase n=1 Tax=Dactylosporangium sp. CS-033363 TaxID=3239935 RepID=UPI003D9266BF